MRVIGGEFRSRRLKSIAGVATRPTPDRLREALFNVLAPRIQGAQFLDLYAGTGAVGIEALSRGAARCVFVEKSRHAAAVLNENLASLGLEARARVILGNVATALARLYGDIVFLDPPYELDREYGLALGILGAAPPPLVIAQHASRFHLKEDYGRLRRTRLLRQGDNSLSFFSEADE